MWLPKSPPPPPPPAMALQAPPLKNTPGTVTGQVVYNISYEQVSDIECRGFFNLWDKGDTLL